MPFEPIEVVNKFNRPPQVSISYQRAERKLKKGGVSKSKVPHLLIAIPTTLAGISKKKYWMMQLGTGKDSGKLRISGQNASNRHTVNAKDHRYAMTFDFGFVPMLGEDAAAKEFVAIRKISENRARLRCARPGNKLSTGQGDAAGMAGDREGICVNAIEKRDI